MASIGTFLRREREKKKIPLDQIAEETKIGSRYLKAIESDDYAAFPGETYIIGFIRNYARALDLDPAEVINMYKSSKIGSVKVPMEGGLVSPSTATLKSTEKKRGTGTKKVEAESEEIEVVEIEDTTAIPSKKKKIQLPNLERLNIFKLPLQEKKFINLAYVTIGVAALIVLILIILLLRVIFISLSKGGKDKIYTDLNEMKYIEFANDNLQSDFVPNEYYKIKLGGKFYSILFEKTTEIVDANKTPDQKSMEFVFHINDVTLPLKLSEEKSVDFDFDGTPDLALKVNSFNNDLINAGIMKLHTFVEIESNQMMTSGTNITTNQNKIQKPKSDKLTTKQKIVFEATVREKTYIKAFVDGKEQEGVIYYPKDTVKLEANDVLQLKIGNAGGINVTINGKPTKLGKRGEIANKIIKWEKDSYDESAFNLIIKDWQ